MNLSNFEETFGRTVLEAMAAGRPVVAYNWGALPELIEQGENGFLVPYKNIEAAAERVRFLCQNLARITLMGAKGRMKARKYDLQGMKCQFGEIFRWLWSNEPGQSHRWLQLFQNNSNKSGADPGLAPQKFRS